MADSIGCDSCRACCCQLEVMWLAGDDELPTRFLEDDEWGGQVMRRLDDGWCAALDRATMRCTIYAQRPSICRDYQAGDSDCMVQRLRIPILAAR